MGRIFFIFLFLLFLSPRAISSSIQEEGKIPISSSYSSDEESIPYSNLDVSPNILTRKLKDEYFSEQGSLESINEEGTKEESYSTQTSYNYTRFPITDESEDNVQASSLNKFRRSLDEAFLKPLSKKSLFGGAFCSLFGALVPHPLTGSILYYTGDFLDIPLNDATTKLAISWLAITLTLPFAQQSFNTGKSVIACIFHEGAFSPSDADDSIPHVFRKNKLHYILKGFLIPCAAITATIPTILMWRAEKEFPLFFSMTAPPSYLAFMTHFYNVGSRNLDYLFRYYNYTDNVTTQIREMLCKRILDFKESIQQDDSKMLQTYTLIKSKINDSSLDSLENSCAFTSLFIRNLWSLKPINNSEEEGSADFAIYKMDMKGHRNYWGDALADEVSTFLTGAGICAKYFITQAVLYELMVEFGINQGEAEIVSESLAGFESLGRILTTAYTQKQYFRGFKTIFSSVNNLFLIRKSAGIASLLNAALTSLPYAVAGLKVFSDVSLPQKVAALLPLFLLDLTYNDSFLNQYANECITNILSAGDADSINIEALKLIRKRAFVHFYADKAYKLVHNQFDDPTIEKIYEMIQKDL